MIENDVSHTFTDTVRKKFIELGFPKATSGQLSKIILPFKVDPIEKKVFARCDNFFYLEQIVKPYQEEIHDIVKKCWGENFVFEIDNSALDGQEPELVNESSIKTNMTTQNENDIKNVQTLASVQVDIQKNSNLSVKHNTVKKHFDNPVITKPDVSIKFSDTNEISQYTFENFIAVEKNIDALNACQYVVQNSSKTFSKPIFLYGETGIGKTHLLHALGNEFFTKNKQIKVLYVCIHDFVNEIIHKGIRLGKMEEIRKKYNSCDVLLIDDVQSLEKKAVCQTEFFHIVTHLLQKNKQLVMASNKHPKDFKNIDPRLKSRFFQGAIIQMHLPEKLDRIQILKQKANNLRLSLSDNTISVMADLLKTNVHEIEGVLNDIAFKTNALKNSINESNIIKIIHDRLPKTTEISNTKRIDLIDLQKIVCQHFGISLQEMKGKQRYKNIALARHLAIYLAKTYLNLSSTVIATAFARAHHKVVSYSVKKISAFKTINEDAQQHLTILMTHIESRQKKI